MKLTKQQAELIAELLFSGEVLTLEEIFEECSENGFNVLSVFPNFKHPFFNMESVFSTQEELTSFLLSSEVENLEKKY